jgi:hypothetical protein
MAPIEPIAACFFGTLFMATLGVAAYSLLSRRPPDDDDHGGDVSGWGA